MTRSRRVYQPPRWHANYVAMALTKVEIDHHENLKEMEKLSMSIEDFKIDNEVAGVGAGLGGGFSIH